MNAPATIPRYAVPMAKPLPRDIIAGYRIIGAVWPPHEDGRGRWNVACVSCGDPRVMLADYLRALADVDRDGCRKCTPRAVKKQAIAAMLPFGLPCAVIAAEVGCSEEYVRLVREGER